jgi:hypothetical protein
MYSLGILYLPENEKNPGEINQEKIDVLMRDVLTRVL